MEWATAAHDRAAPWSFFSPAEVGIGRIKVTDSKGSTTVSVYDAIDNFLSITDPDGNTTAYVYDHLNRQVSMTDVLGHTATWIYDKEGNLLSTTDRNGQTRNMAYDSLNRLLSTTWLASDGVTVTDVRTYSYDLVDNQLTASNFAGTYTMTYDALNRMVTNADPFGLTLTYGYDKVDNQISVKDSLGGLTTSLFDNANRLTSRRFSGTGQAPLRIDFTYLPGGQVATETRYSDLAGTHKVGFSQFTYDADNRLIHEQHQDGVGTVLADFVYTYDPASLLSSEIDNGVTTNYSYDAINQLLTAGSLTETYDPNGNRTATGYVTGPNNELLSDGVWNFSYDANGNQIGKTNIATGETWTFTFDDANQMTGAVQKDHNGVLLTATTYGYDVVGNRISKTVFDNTTSTTTTLRFAYNGAQIWADLNGSNALQTRYILGDNPNEYLARESGAGVANWYLTDHLGSVRNILSLQGVVLDKIDTDAFGNITNETNATVGGRIKWQGGEFDAETGNYHFGARNVDPTNGHWTTQDPLGLKPDSNPYRVMGNDSVNTTDPTGQIFGFRRGPLAAGFDPGDVWKELSEEEQAKWNRLVDKGWRLATDDDGGTTWNMNTHFNISVEVKHSIFKEKSDVYYLDDAWAIDWDSKTIYIDAYLDNSAEDYIRTVLRIIKEEKEPETSPEKTVDQDIIEVYRYGRNIEEFPGTILCNELQPDHSYIVAKSKDGSIHTFGWSGDWEQDIEFDTSMVGKSRYGIVDYYADEYLGETRLVYLREAVKQLRAESKPTGYCSGLCGLSGYTCCGAAGNCHTHVIDLWTRTKKLESEARRNFGQAGPDIANEFNNELNIGGVGRVK